MTDSRPRVLRFVAAALVSAALALVTGCQSGGAESGNRSAGGSNLWDRFEEQRTARKGAPPVQALDAGAGELPPGWRAKMDASWAAFLADRPEWPAGRAEWLALGPAARNILAENLIRAYVLSFETGDGGINARAKEEVTLLEREALPILVTGLAGGYGDDVVANRCGELLGHFGDASVAPILDAYPGASGKGRRSLVRALKKIQSPRSVPFLIELARSSAGFELRIEAIQTLGQMGSREAVPAFRDCLGDDDVSVRKFAATWISGLGDRSPETIEALASCMERATAALEGEVARACRGSLKRLAGRDLGPDAPAWRAWAKSAR